MKFAVTLVTSDYRGDHSADVSLAFESQERETVEDLLKRVGLLNVNDHVEIRLSRANHDERAVVNL
jgi:hypothetical protein